MSAKKYTVDLESPLLDMKGEPVDPPITVGKIIGDRIGASASDKNVIKLYGWASTLVQGKPLELDSEDFTSLKSFIELLPSAPIFVKAQAIECFNAAAAEKKE